MIYGLIFTAGKQSRFDSETPKALMPYGNHTLLDINIANMSTVCDKTFVVCSHENHTWFETYPHIEISSGRGCGDAVLTALSHLDLVDDDTVFIQWGDCLHTKDIYYTLKDVYKGQWLIPCVYEESPYVQIIPSINNKVTVNFSKYHESITSGFHDLSLFYGGAKLMREHLQCFADNISVDGCYTHKHGNELQFLDVFNETDINASIVAIADYESFDFNTLEEFHVLMNNKILR